MNARRVQSTPLPDEDRMLIARLDEIFRKQQLSALFQPILGMRSGTILGYEGLIRGPSDSILHSPFSLFKVAREVNRSVELERLCCAVVIKHFMQQNLPGKLFVNLSPECLLQYQGNGDYVLNYMQGMGITSDRVIIELTECQPTYDYDQLKDAVTRCRRMGFQIAIDDLGEGFSSLRLWSEVRPDFVKIDMHFIQGIHLDPIKRQFVRSIQEIAQNSGAQVIAEGIETDAEFTTIADLGIAYGQGYHIARPHAQPTRTMRSAIIKKRYTNDKVGDVQNGLFAYSIVTAEKLLNVAPWVSPQLTNNQVYDLLVENPSWQILPVVKGERPIGLIARSRLFDHFARPFLRELHGKRECTTLMDPDPLIVDKATTLQELSQTMVEAARHHLSNGFIITDQGRYLSIGSGQDLMRELTQIQINTARYANPLTLLPGNVPIHEHIENLLRKDIPFAACYADLDHFKPFNDVYGYRNGDDVIQTTAGILRSHCDPQSDFLGHIGGDDFMIIFQSTDWEFRCASILEAFAQAVPGHHTDADRERGGYASEDRSGKPVFCPMVSLSLGALIVDPGSYSSHYQVAAATAEAKKEAKKIAGNSLFIERRKPLKAANL
jgi:EAL domain-containing protein (putative c-di-GMP-specific phosphodiesterase class I)/GGDEF domain-containing protein